MSVPMSDGPVGGPADNPPSPASPPAWRWRLPGPWRVGTALVLLMGSVLLIVSENSSGGTDLRPGRYNDLASLVNNESRRVKAQQEQVAALTAEVETLTAGVQNEEADETRRQADQLRGAAGLEPVNGPGVTVTLSDAPIEDINALSTDDLNPFVVHQQDIQAVVNALWSGGATAVTVQGQRVISTTGIKCEGNSVTLQGVPYPQPYVIAAVGDQTALFQALQDDPVVQGYQVDAADPEISVGWELTLENLVQAPAYDGLLDLAYAEAIN
ncbi:DUF881 domain-containing protein [Nocardioides bigeumensis]|uniref:DUF881 domain-containing protein n=1 Tax=Nocardioides bigeumensis TaxID=433657 RepID=UPI0031D7B91F